VQEAIADFGCSELGRNLLPRFGADGVFGAETRSAVEAFQSARNIAADGIVGPVTLMHLDLYLLGALPPVPGVDVPNECRLVALDTPAAQVDKLRENGLTDASLGKDETDAGEGLSAVLPGFALLCNLKGGGASRQQCNPRSLCGGGKEPVVNGQGGSFRVCDFQQAVKEGILISVPDRPVTMIAGQWTFAGSVAACLPNDVPDNVWEWGFIQTVENLSFIAEYARGWEEHRVVPVPARDAADTVFKGGVPVAVTPADPPWYSPDSVVDFSAEEAPVLVDSPRARFPALQPRTKRPPDLVGGLVVPGVKPCAPIERVSAEGKFHVWLIVRRTDRPLDPASLVFLKHAQIEFSVSLAAPKVSVENGRGSARPVLDGIPGRDFVRVALTFAGDPCPVILDSKD
jgi:hypothetical protein